MIDPIPVNGDYFTKSAREYAIELNIKDDYDKYYEYNSEFIHASLTAVYVGIMLPCMNLEHDFHLNQLILNNIIIQKICIDNLKF